MFVHLNCKHFLCLCLIWCWRYYCDSSVLNWTTLRFHLTLKYWSTYESFDSRNLTLSFTIVKNRIWRSSFQWNNNNTLPSKNTSMKIIQLFDRYYIQKLKSRWFSFIVFILFSSTFFYPIPRLLNELDRLYCLHFIF